MNQEERFLDKSVDYVIDKVEPKVNRIKSKFDETSLFFTLPYFVRLFPLFFACFILALACILINFYGVTFSLLFLSVWGREFPSLGLVGPNKILFASFYVVASTAFILFFMVLALRRNVNNNLGIGQRMDFWASRMHPEGSALGVLFKFIEVSLSFLEKPRIGFHLIVLAISFVVLLLI